MNSFLFLPGIGTAREAALWRHGITHWQDYPQYEPPACIPAGRHGDHCRLLQHATQALDEHDLGALARLIPKNEHWRFWGPHAPRVGCLDIETTGTHRAARVTVVGVYDPAHATSHQLIAGRDLDAHRLQELLAGYDLLVTFNGNGFDLPVLRQHYKTAVPEVPHLDLRGPLGRLGYRGGLKRIEQDLGLKRPDALDGIDGFEAVRLWRRHERGDPNALATLLAYNDEDIRNLAPLARFATTALNNRHAPLLGQHVKAIPWPSGQRPERIPERLAAILQTHMEPGLV